MAYSRFPVAVHILLLRADEVLLIRRCNTGFADGKLSVDDPVLKFFPDELKKPLGHW